MMLVVTYDVDTSDAAGQKRLRKVAKICERHGMRVQNSVFEVLVDAAHLVILKNELEKVIDLEQDSVRFYRLGNSYENRIETMGKKASRRSRKRLDLLAPTLPVHNFAEGPRKNSFDFRGFLKDFSDIRGISRKKPRDLSAILHKTQHQLCGKLPSPLPWGRE